MREVVGAVLVDEVVVDGVVLVQRSQVVEIATSVFQPQRSSFPCRRQLKRHLHRPLPLRNQSSKHDVPQIGLRLDHVEQLQISHARVLVLHEKSGSVVTVPLLVSSLRIAFDC